MRQRGGPRRPRRRPGACATAACRHRCAGWSARRPETEQNLPAAVGVARRQGLVAAVALRGELGEFSLRSAPNRAFAARICVFRLSRKLGRTRGSSAAAAAARSRRSGRTNSTSPASATDSSRVQKELTSGPGVAPPARGTRPPSPPAAREPPSLGSAASQHAAAPPRSAGVSASSPGKARRRRRNAGLERKRRHEDVFGDVGDQGDDGGRALRRRRRPTPAWRLRLQNRRRRERRGRRAGCVQRPRRERAHALRGLRVWGFGVIATSACRSGPDASAAPPRAAATSPARRRRGRAEPMGPPDAPSSSAPGTGNTLATSFPAARAVERQELRGPGRTAWTAPRRRRRRGPPPAEDDDVVRVRRGDGHLRAGVQAARPRRPRDGSRPALASISTATGGRARRWRRRRRRRPFENDEPVEARDVLADVAARVVGSSPPAITR